MKNATDGDQVVPKVIGTSTVELGPVLEKWRQENAGVPWSVLLQRALKSYPEVKRLAGKRYAHLIDA